MGGAVVHPHCRKREIFLTCRTQLGPKIEPPQDLISGDVVAFDGGSPLSWTAGGGGLDPHF